MSSSHGEFRESRLGYSSAVLKGIRALVPLLSATGRTVRRFLLLQRKPSVALVHTADQWAWLYVTSTLRFIWWRYRAPSVLLRLSASLRVTSYTLLQTAILLQTSVWKSVRPSRIRVYKRYARFISFCTSNSSVVNTEPSVFTLQFFASSFLYYCPHSFVADGVCLFSCKLKTSYCASEMRLKFWSEGYVWICLPNKTVVCSRVLQLYSCSCSVWSEHKL